MNENLYTTRGRKEGRKEYILVLLFYVERIFFPLPLSFFLFLYLKRTYV